MKKFLSMVTALSCMTSLISALPAFAEDKIYSYVVIGVNYPEYQETYLLADTQNGYDYSVPAKLIAKQMNDVHFTVGDVLEFHNAYLCYSSDLWEAASYSSASPLSYSGYEEEEEDETQPDGKKFIPYQASVELCTYSQKDTFILKTGSITETPEIKDFTYSSRYLTDGTENYTAPLSFRYKQEYFCQPDAYEYDFLQDGDTVSCYTYEGKPYIAINDSQEDTFQDYLFTGKENSNLILVNTEGNIISLDTQEFSSFLINDSSLIPGHVFRFRNLSPELETIKDTPHAPAIALHFSKDFSQYSYLKFDVTASDETSVTLSRDEKTYTFPIDFITEAYNPETENADLLKEEILTQKTAFCQVWNGMPFRAVPAESLDYISRTVLYVLSVDNSENPQQYVLSTGYQKPVVFTREELQDFLPDPNLKIGDVLQIRNLNLEYGDNNNFYFSVYPDVFESRPCDLTVTASLLENPQIQELTLWANNSSYTRVKLENNNFYNLYAVPEGFETFPAPDISNLKAGDKVPCLMSGNIPIALYDGKIAPTGDADGSGELDILDIITVNKAILGKENLSEDRISFVDFNGNGVPDADDALTMLKMLVGLI